MSKWSYGSYDWENPIFMKQRDKLVDLIPELDEFFDEVREDNHEGSCWDLINGLAMLLTHRERSTPPSQEAPNSNILKRRDTDADTQLHDKD